MCVRSPGGREALLSHDETQEAEKWKPCICPLAVTIWWYSNSETTPCALPYIECWFTQADILPSAKEPLGEDSDPERPGSPCAAFSAVS